MIVSGAAPLGEELGSLLKQRFPGVDLLQGYGMTELSPVVSISRMNNTKLASCGVLLANTRAKIVMEVSPSSCPSLSPIHVYIRTGRRPLCLETVGSFASRVRRLANLKHCPHITHRLHLPHRF